METDTGLCTDSDQAFRVIVEFFRIAFSAAVPTFSRLPGKESDQICKNCHGGSNETSEDLAMQPLQMKARNTMCRETMGRSLTAQCRS
jgi:hypothetical protein